MRSPLHLGCQQKPRRKTTLLLPPGSNETGTFSPAGAVSEESAKSEDLNGV